MALFVKQNGDRSELQTRISSDLQQRLKEKNRIATKKSDPVFMDDKVQTTGYGVVIAVVSIVVIGIALYLLRP